MTFQSTLVNYNWNRPIVLFDFLYLATYVVLYVSSVLNICQWMWWCRRWKCSETAVEISHRIKCIYDRCRCVFISRLLLIFSFEKRSIRVYTRIRIQYIAHAHWHTHVLFSSTDNEKRLTNEQHRTTEIKKQQLKNFIFIFMSFVSSE